MTTDETFPGGDPKDAGKSTDKVPMHPQSLDHPHADSGKKDRPTKADDAKSAAPVSERPGRRG